MHLKSKYPWWLYASWHFSWNNKYNFDVGDKDDDNDDDDLIEGESEHQWTSDDDDAAAADDVDDDDDDADDANDDNVHLIESEPEHLPGNNCPLSKGGSPEVGGITAINTSQLDVFFSLICFFSVVDMTHKRSYSYKFDGQMTFIALHFSVTFVTAYLLVILKLSFCFWHVLPFGYPKTNVLLTHLFSVLTWLTFWLS